jgi:hypothetical protein
MKQTLTTSQIAYLLHVDSNANWSYAGARALAEWLQEMEESTGEETELDVVAIRCDFSEWKSLQEWAADYFGGDWRTEFSDFSEEVERADELEKSGEVADAESIRETIEEDIDSEIRDYIDGNGHLIEFDGGVIVSAF